MQPSTVALGESITLPIKSKAQRRKFAQLLTEGKISEEAFERWNRETGSAELPEHVKKKTKKKKATRKVRCETRRRLFGRTSSR